MHGGAGAFCIFDKCKYLVGVRLIAQEAEERSKTNPAPSAHFRD